MARFRHPLTYSVYFILKEALSPTFGPIDCHQACDGLCESKEE